MSFKAGAIHGDIFLNGKPAKEAEDDVLRHTKSFRSGMDKELKDSAAAGEKSYKDMLKGIKGELGKNSALGQTLKLAMGGGAVAGFSMAGNELAGFVDSMREVSKASREAGDDWGTFIGKIGTTLPGVGGFWKAGQSIREMFTGEQAQIDAILNEAQQMNAYWTKQVELAGKYHETMKGLKNLALMGREEIAKIGASDTNKQEIDENRRHRDAMKQINEEAKKSQLELNAERENARKNARGDEFERVSRQFNEVEGVRKFLQEHGMEKTDWSTSWWGRIGTEGGGGLGNLKVKWDRLSAELQQLQKEEADRQAGLIPQFAQKERERQTQENDARRVEEQQHWAKMAEIRKLGMQHLQEIVRPHEEAAFDLGGQNEAIRMRLTGNDYAAGIKEIEMQTLVAQRAAWHKFDGELKSLGEHPSDVDFSFLTNSMTRELLAIKGKGEAELRALREAPMRDAELQTRLTNKTPWEAAKLLAKDNPNADALGLEAMKKAGLELKRANESPRETLNRMFDEISQLKEAGAIDQTTFNRATKRAYNEYVGDGHEGGVGAVRAGSYEAMRLATPTARDTVPMQQLEMQREANRYLLHIRAALEAMGMNLGTMGANE